MTQFPFIYFRTESKLPLRIGFKCEKSPETKICSAYNEKWWLPNKTYHFPGNETIS